MTSFQNPHYSSLYYGRCSFSSVFSVREFFSLADYLLLEYIHSYLFFIRKKTPHELGLNQPASWLSTFGFAIAGLLIMLAYSPIADKLATRFFEEPPTLDAFTGLEESKTKLIAGIVAMWVLGGILEELIVWGIVLLSVKVMLIPWTTKSIATIIAIIPLLGALGFIALNGRASGSVAAIVAGLLGMGGMAIFSIVMDGYKSDFQSMLLQISYRSGYWGTWLGFIWLVAAGILTVRQNK